MSYDKHWKWNPDGIFDSADKTQSHLEIRRDRHPLKRLCFFFEEEIDWLSSSWRPWGTYRRREWRGSAHSETIKNVYTHFSSISYFILLFFCFTFFSLWSKPTCAYVYTSVEWNVILFIHFIFPSSKIYFLNLSYIHFFSVGSSLSLSCSLSHKFSSSSSSSPHMSV